MLCNNHPAISYVSWLGLVIIIKSKKIEEKDDGSTVEVEIETPYIISDGKSCMKYLYWESDNNPYVLKESNEWIKETTTRKMIYINDNGTGTEVPHDDISVYYNDTGNGTSSKLVGEALGKFDELNGKYMIVKEDVDGIKEVLGYEGEGEVGSLIERLNKVEKTAEGTFEKITTIEKEFNNDKELEDLRDNMNISFIDIGEALLDYEDVIDEMSKDLEVSTEEKNTISEKQASLSNAYSNLSKYHSELISRLEASQEDNNATILKLNQALSNLGTSITNLNENVNTAISDNTVAPSELTTMLNFIANVALKNNEYKNAVSDSIMLGIGGKVTESFLDIKKTSNNFSQTISEIQYEIDSETGLKKQISDNKTAIEQNSKEISLKCVKFNDTTSQLTVGDGFIKLDAGKTLMTGTLTWDTLDDETKENLKGEPGSAEFISLTGEQVIKYDKNGTPNLTSITLSAVVSNIDNPTFTWYYKNPSQTTWQRLASTTQSITIKHDDIVWSGNDSATIKVVCKDDFYDQMTIIKLYDGKKGDAGVPGTDGKDGYTVILTNEAHAFPCENNGNISSVITATTQVKAFRGTTEVPAVINSFPTVLGFWIWKENDSTLTIQAYTGTDLASSGSFDITITVEGITFTKSFSWSKAYTGAPGSEANLPSWITEWDNGKTTINGSTVLTPKLFAGTVTNGVPTGVAVGKNVFGTSGTYNDVNGIVGYKNGTRMYTFNTDGSVLIGNSGGNHISWNGSSFEVKADKISIGSSEVSTKEYIDSINVGTRNLLRWTNETKYLTGDGNQNQSVKLFDISDNSKLHGETGTLAFKYKVTNWSSGGSFHAQTGTTTWDGFDKVTLSGNGEFWYVSTITFNNSNWDNELRFRMDGVRADIEIVANTAILVISDKKADWSPAPEDTDYKFASLENNISGFKTTVAENYATNGTVSGLATRMSQVEQTSSSLTAKFTDGFTMGIIEQNANGIKVYHNEINGENYTHIAPSGFWLKYKGENIFKVNSDGLYIKGNITSGSTITGATINGGSLTIGSNFSVDKNGNLSAIGAILKSKYANNGDIVTIDSGEITSRNDNYSNWTTITPGKLEVTADNHSTLTINDRTYGSYERIQVGEHISFVESGKGISAYIGDKKYVQFQPYSTNGNLALGYGMYEASTGATNIYGHKMNFTYHWDSSSPSTTGCVFGNNFFSNGSLTINQKSIGTVKGTQTYLSGTTISATNIYQNGSSVSGSDIVLKDNIKEYKDSALDIIKQTKVYSFNRILANQDKTEIGFLAQQVPDIFIFDKGEFTAEELNGLTAEDKKALLAKKTEDYKAVLENRKLDEISENIASFYDLDSEQTEEQINQIMDEYHNMEYEVPISTINQNNIIAIMFKAIQELKAEIDELKNK